MGWFSNTVDLVREKTSVAPIECPRGWGQITFATSFETFWPWFSIERKCPIGGVESCVDCEHPVNPDVLRLEGQLDELERLRRGGAITDEECDQQRRAIFEFMGPTPPGNGLRIAAWILTPLGFVLLGAGLGLTLLVNEHLWGIALGGGLLTALGVGFFGASGPRPEKEVTQLE